MPKFLKLLLPCLLAACPRPALCVDAAKADAGTPFAGVGVYYDGSGGSAAAPLLVYYRGWVGAGNYPGGGLSGGHITGSANIVRSAAAALKFYKLAELAAEKGLVVLVTGSSDIAVRQAEIDALGRELGKDFTGVYAAAHSGGYVGLSASLPSLARLDALVLLDPFYSDFSAAVLARTQAGAACGGFYTPHNKARYQKWFTGAGCAVDESFSAADHEGWVGPSLKKHLP